MGTPSAQNEAAISHADQDQDSRSDLSSVLSVELNVGPNTNTNNQDPTRDSTLTGTTSYNFNFPDRNLDSVGDESHSDGS